MELKVKFLKWSAGLPVVMLNKKTALKLGVHTQGRISIKTLSKHPKEISSIIDTIESNSVNENEILVSSEVRKRLSLKIKQKVDVNISQETKSLSFIKKKLNNKKLTKKEITEIIRNIANNSLSEPEIALFIAAMYKQGMSIKEIIYMTEAILKFGNKLKIKKEFVVDKHSIGGIAGNRTTPIVISICSAAGLTFPKTSSRAITSEAGTVDVIETVAKVEFSVEELQKILKKTNAFMVWGGSLGMVPADSKIIKIEKILKIDPKSQLIASIMSKKFAVGSKYIVIDIPYGKGAKVNKEKANELKNKFTKLAKHFDKKIKIVLTEGNQPIGNGIGPALELIDIVKVLDSNQQGPKDLEKKSVFLAGEIFNLTGKTKNKKGIELAEEILRSGKAFEKFKQIIKIQGGNLEKIKQSKFKKDVFAKKSGKIKEINNKKIISLARILGCPVDKSSGIYLYFHNGEKVEKRQKILTLYSETKTRLNEAIKFYNKEKIIKIN
jgi:putative thymidine phosphorylase|tara:strand:- start:652 stop:2136 length:1485 start_codon:yes stop_codon:yes gene_type:complete